MMHRAPLALALLLPALLVPSGAAAMTLPPADQTWLRVETAHLTLYSNASEEATVRIGQSIEVFRAALARIGPSLSADSPLPTSVFVFRDDLSFRPYKPLQRGRREGAPMNISGFFVKHPDGNYVGIDATPPSDPWSVIYHEYFHFFLYNNFTDIPLWFSEGMAECYGTFRISGSRAEVGGPIEAHVQWLRKNPMIPPRRLFAIGFESPEYHEESRQGTYYAEAWALAQYLLWGPGSQKGGAVRFLHDLPRGASLTEAVASITSTNDAELLERLDAYVKKGSFAFSAFDIDAPGTEQAPRIARIPRDEVLYRLGDYLLHVDPDRLDDAMQHFQEAIRLNPSHGPAHTGTGQVLAGRGLYGDAQAAFEKGIALDPSNQLLSLEYAHALIAQAFPPGVRRMAPRETAPPELLRARELYARITKDRPEIAEAWAGLGATYAYENGDVKPGIAALEKARALLPARTDISLNLASLYAQSGQREKASALIDGVILRSDDSEMRSAGKEVLFQADILAADALFKKGETQAAVDAMQKLAESAPTPAAKVEAQKRVAQYRSLTGQLRDVALYNEAIQKANAGDLDGAMRQLESFLATTKDEKLRAQAADLLASVSQTQRYNQAVARYNKRDYDGAAALLRKVVGESKDPKLVAAAKDLLAKARAASDAH